MISAIWNKDRPYCGRCRSEKAFGNAEWSGFYNGLLVSTRWHERDGRWVHGNRSNRKPNEGRPMYFPLEFKDGRKMLQIGLPSQLVCQNCDALNEVAPPTP